MPPKRCCRSLHLLRWWILLTTGSLFRGLLLVVLSSQTVDVRLQVHPCLSDWIFEPVEWIRSTGLSSKLLSRFPGPFVDVRKKIPVAMTDVLLQRRYVSLQPREYQQRIKPCFTKIKGSDESHQWRIVRAWSKRWLIQLEGVPPQCLAVKSPNQSRAAGYPTL